MWLILHVAEVYDIKYRDESSLKLTFCERLKEVRDDQN